MARTFLAFTSLPAEIHYNFVRVRIISRMAMARYNVQSLAFGTELHAMQNEALEFFKVEQATSSAENKRKVCDGKVSEASYVFVKY